ncbi:MULTISPECIES: transposase [Nonomuraea]|uniref:Transposase n=1 Tax=Nonomuraea mangrovi TaxID=2316207 RepID=A0ABW4TCT6_9ACTN
MLAADVSPWLRPDAATSPDRSFCHAYGRSEKTKHQMIPGWPYSIVAALETGRTPWTTLLDAVRLEPGADLAQVSAARLLPRGVRLQTPGSSPQRRRTPPRHPASYTCPQPGMFTKSRTRRSEVGLRGRLPVLG